MERCLGASVRKVSELRRRKYCSFQLQRDVVIVSCRETQTKDGRFGLHGYTLDTTYGLHFESLRAAEELLDETAIRFH